MNTKVLPGNGTAVDRMQGLKPSDIRQFRRILENEFTRAELTQIDRCIEEIREQRKKQVAAGEPRDLARTPAFSEMLRLIESRVHRLRQQAESSGAPVAGAGTDGGRHIQTSNVFVSIFGEDDAGAIDFWTLMHYTSGVLLGKAGLRPETVLDILVAWELVEPGLWPGWDESAGNVTMDVLIGMLGYFGLDWYYVLALVLSAGALDRS